VLLRARLLVPVTGPAIEDGALWIQQGRIKAIGSFPHLRHIATGSPKDLGDVVVFPGLINAHCHLDYTHMLGVIAPPKSFSAWIKSILTAKSGWGPTEFARSWLSGARQLIETGTTTVANIESFPSILPEVLTKTPLRVCSHLELTGVRSPRTDPEIVEEARQILEDISRLGAPGDVGLSPHAPYSTRPGLLSGAAELSRKFQWRLIVHVAESIEEFEMFMYRRGPMHDWLRPQRSMDDCGQGSPVQHLDRHHVLMPGTLAVHANYLWQSDALTLARRGVSVVHCPRSHAYFRHQRFPLQQLEQAGVNVCLGTDSLATVRVPPSIRTSATAGSHAPAPPEPVLTMQAEFRALAAWDSNLSPERILQMGTVHGANALGLSDVRGSLQPDARADLAVLPYSGRTATVAESIIAHRGRVDATMIAGRWAWIGPRLKSLLGSPDSPESNEPQES
jgi:aminodeoxyfutalosine deaminase